MQKKYIRVVLFDVYITTSYCKRNTSVSYCLTTYIATSYCKRNTSVSYCLTYILLRLIAKEIHPCRIVWRIYCYVLLQKKYIRVVLFDVYIATSYCKRNTSVSYCLTYILLRLIAKEIHPCRIVWRIYCYVLLQKKYIRVVLFDVYIATSYCKRNTSVSYCLTYILLRLIAKEIHPCRIVWRIYCYVLLQKKYIRVVLFDVYIATSYCKRNTSVSYCLTYILLRLIAKEIHPCRIVWRIYCYVLLQKKYIRVVLFDVYIATSYCKRNTSVSYCLTYILLRLIAKEIHPCRIVWRIYCYVLLQKKYIRVVLFDVYIATSYCKRNTSVSYCLTYILLRLIAKEIHPCRIVWRIYCYVLLQKKYIRVVLFNVYIATSYCKRNTSVSYCLTYILLRLIAKEIHPCRIVWRIYCYVLLQKKYIRVVLFDVYITTSYCKRNTSVSYCLTNILLRLIAKEIHPCRIVWRIYCYVLMQKKYMRGVLFDACVSYIFMWRSIDGMHYHFHKEVLSNVIISLV